jgi:hypothetical protein
MMSGLADDAEDVGFVDDEVVLAIDFDFGAAVFGDEDFVALLHGEESADVFAFVVLAGAESDDFCLLGLLLCRVRKEDAASGFFFAAAALNKHSTAQRGDRGSHTDVCVFLVCGLCCLFMCRPASCDPERAEQQIAEQKRMMLGDEVRLLGHLADALGPCFHGQVPGFLSAVFIHAESFGMALSSHGPGGNDELEGVFLVLLGHLPLDCPDTYCAGGIVAGRDLGALQGVE